MLVVKDGKQVRSDGVELRSGEVMKDVDENGYKYLGVSQAENVKNREMKDKVRNEYMRRVKLLVKSELYAGNLVKGINTWAIGVVRYSAGVFGLDKRRPKADGCEDKEDADLMWSLPQEGQCWKTVSEEEGRRQGCDQCGGLSASGGGRPEYLCPGQRGVDVEGCR